MKSNLIVLIAGCLFANGLAFTQEPDTPATTQKVVYVQGSSTKDVDDQIGQLQQVGKALEKQLNDVNLGVEETAGEAESVDDSVPNQNIKVDEIKKNLALLKQVIKDKQAREMAEAKKKQRLKEMLPDPGVQLNETEKTKSATTTNEPADDIRVPKRVTDRIVNAFELANSLFLAGNIDQAIKYYEIVPADRLSAFERNWLEFMIANCHLKMKQYEQAEAGFRTVSGFQDSPRVASSAKQSLNYILSRKRLTGLVEEYGARADEAIKAASSLIGEPENGIKN